MHTGQKIRIFASILGIALFIAGLATKNEEDGWSMQGTAGKLGVAGVLILTAAVFGPAITDEEERIANSRAMSAGRVNPM